MLDFLVIRGFWLHRKGLAGGLFKSGAELHRVHQ